MKMPMTGERIRTLEGLYTAAMTRRAVIVSKWGSGRFPAAFVINCQGRQLLWLLKSGVWLYRKAPKESRDFFCAHCRRMTPHTCRDRIWSCACGQWYDAPKRKANASRPVYRRSASETDARRWPGGVPWMTKPNRGFGRKKRKRT
jgi:hypothetical protein